MYVIEKIYLGIDIGGTTIKTIFYKKSIDIRHAQFSSFPTPQNRKDFLREFTKQMKKLTGTQKIAGIAVGLPGVIDLEKGILLVCPNLPFLNKWHARKFFETNDIPLKIDNDSRCFLRAESKNGAAKGYKNVIAITVGTGIGGGIMVEGKIFYGTHGSAGEFGHMVIDQKETFEHLGAKKAFEQYGDRSEVIGIGVANLINAFDPEIIVIGGGGVVSGGININNVKRIARQFIISLPAQKTPIVKGMLGQRAQAAGAALLFQEG